MKQMKYISPLCLLLLVVAGALHAQVSVGTGASPAKGMLLQVKDTEPNFDNVHTATDVANVTSKKGGIVLPRVKLLAEDSLEPLVTTVNPTVKKEHTGLIVYNINEDINICPGMYVWGGEGWSLLKVSEPGTQHFTDRRDNEIYAYRSFGSAGYWMIDNIRATEYSDGTPLAANSYFAPNKNMANKENGLLYQWASATNGKSETGNEGNAITPSTKGICPDGWHLPSDFEWNQLEQIMSDEQTARFNKQFYKPQVWNTGWATTQAVSRGSHGKAMKSTDKTNSIATNGLSKSVICGGFNVLLIGSVGASSNVEDYGSAATYWTSSSRSVTEAWSRELHNSDNGVKRQVHNRTNSFSVRCKKD